MLIGLLTTLALTAAPADDLRVEARLKTPTVIEPGQRVEVEALLINTSRTATHRVVKPNDGSEVGWREPEVFYTAETDSGDGIWRPVAKGAGGRCGLFAQDWPRDIIDLKPGESIKLEWLSSPQWALDLPQSGKVRLRLHYAWQRQGKRRAGIDPETTAMAGIAPYEIVSDAMEFLVQGQLRVDLIARGAFMRAGTPIELARALKISLKNTVNAPVEAGKLRLYFEVKGWSTGARPSVKRVAGRSAAKTLARGGAIELIGTARPVFEGYWDYPKAETIKIRAAVHREVGRKSTTFKSDWVSVVVHP